MVITVACVRGQGKARWDKSAARLSRSMICGSIVLQVKGAKIMYMYRRIALGSGLLRTQTRECEIVSDQPNEQIDMVSSVGSFKMSDEEASENPPPKVQADSLKEVVRELLREDPSLLVPAAAAKKVGGVTPASRDYKYRAYTGRTVGC